MHILKIIWLSSFLLSLSGCGNWNSVYHTHKFTDNASALVDINTRTILTSREITDTTDLKTNITTRKTIDRTCAEPSPDALTTYAANLSANKDIATQIKLNVSGGYSSTGEYVGNRTETIQLLRDQLYRLCEAYINNAIDKDAYEMLVLRSQRYTLALMATDSLAQIANPQRQLTPARQSSNAQKTAEAELEKLKKDETSLKSSSATDKDAKLADNKKLQDAQIKIITDETKKLESAAKPSNTDASGQVTTENITNAMTLIITGLIGSGDEAYKCFNYMKNLERNGLTPTTTQGSPGEILNSFCKGVFDRIALSNNELKTDNPVNPGGIKLHAPIQMYQAPIKLIPIGSGI